MQIPLQPGDEIRCVHWRQWHVVFAQHATGTCAPSRCCNGGAGRRQSILPGNWIVGRRVARSRRRRRLPSRFTVPRQLLSGNDSDLLAGLLAPSGLPGRRFQVYQAERVALPVARPVVIANRTNVSAHLFRRATLAGKIRQEAVSFSVELCCEGLAIRDGRKFWQEQGHFRTDIALAFRAELGPDNQERSISSINWTRSSG